MNALKFFMIIFLLECLIYSCEESDSSQEFVPKPVVEGYLYEGTPVRNLKISELVKFDEVNDFGEKLISGLDIKIRIDHAEYPLYENPDHPGYYGTENDDLILQPAQNIEFSFLFNSTNVSASTRVPSKPLNLSISDAVKYISPIQSYWDLQQLAEISVQVRWTNDDHSYYYISVKNIETNPQTLDPEDLLPDLGNSFDIPPLATDFSNIFFNKIQYYGRYMVVVSKVNAEYTAIYQSQNQDSRTLTELASNIENGYGIFTALAADTVYFEIKEP